MDFKTKVSELMALGYKRASARAKIAHDVVLAAIKASGMKDSVTIKGGVVMSGITKEVRRGGGRRALPYGVQRGQFPPAVQMGAC